MNPHTGGYPKTLYVRRYEDEQCYNNEKWVALEYCDKFAEFGSRVIVAEYKLVKTFGLTTQVKKD